MNQNLTAVAKDNMVRISPTKLSILVNSIVNMKVSLAVNQLKFSSKRISLTNDSVIIVRFLRFRIPCVR